MNFRFRVAVMSTCTEIEWQHFKYYNCDWISENQPKCHTGPIPFYWPS